MLAGVVVISSLLLSLTEAHVALKFPPARALDLDFLDNIRTSGDCGMEEGQTRTVLQSGSSLNLTWHLGYAHQGGYRLELVDPSENIAQLLLPERGDENSWETSMGIFSQSHLVQLPNTQCDNCYLKFERQAREWGGQYKFRSCSDVRLLTSVGDSQRCSGRGTWDGATCQCNRLREGDRCQYETLCQTDADCNGPKGQGRCLTVDSSIFPYKECYCADGWYGEQCERENRWGAGQARSVDPAAFSSHQLGNGAELLWRVAGGEVEMVMTAVTNTWVGIGWRPQGADKSCHAFPSTIAKYSSPDFSGMDCNDMVIGAAREGVGRVADYYTRDRSTPRLDSVWGGEDDLVSAHAWEEDGNTRMRFLKKVSGGPGDHDVAGSLLVVWAHGQLDTFYKEDQLKFHSRSNRGVTSLDLPKLPGASGLIGALGSPMNIGILVSCILVAIILLVQVYQNYDKRLSSYKNKK